MLKVVQESHRCHHKLCDGFEGFTGERGSLSEYGIRRRVPYRSSRRSAGRTAVTRVRVWPYCRPGGVGRSQKNPDRVPLEENTFIYNVDRVGGSVIAQQIPKRVADPRGQFGPPTSRDTEGLTQKNAGGDFTRTRGESQSGVLSLGEIAS